MAMFRRIIFTIGKIAIAAILSVAAYLIMVALVVSCDLEKITRISFGFGWIWLVGCLVIGAVAVPFITCLFYLRRSLGSMILKWLFTLLAVNLLAALLVCGITLTTMWRCRRLDPVAFWKDRVVWHDDSATFAANRRGRAYPPMPYEDPAVLDRIDVDRYGYDDDSPHAWNERESAFWSKFTRTHPKPPKNIARWMQREADSWLRTKHILENDQEMAKRLKYRASELNAMLNSDLENAADLGYPKEGVSPETYHWDHVMRKRIEYEELMNGPWADNATRVESFFSNVYVDKKLITEPLTADDIKAANAWKVAYLRRLRAEKWDESYINAYLKRGT